MPALPWADDELRRLFHNCKMFSLPNACCTPGSWVGSCHRSPSPHLDRAAFSRSTRLLRGLHRPGIMCVERSRIQPNDRVASVPIEARHTCFDASQYCVCLARGEVHRTERQHGCKVQSKSCAKEGLYRLPNPSYCVLQIAREDQSFRCEYITRCLKCLWWVGCSSV